MVYLFKAKNCQKAEDGAAVKAERGESSSEPCGSDHVPRPDGRVKRKAERLPRKKRQLKPVPFKEKLTETMEMIQIIKGWDCGEDLKKELIERTIRQDERRRQQRREYRQRKKAREAAKKLMDQSDDESSSATFDEFEFSWYREEVEKEYGCLQKKV
ncbi:hypothetical protein ANCCAN_24192 [Ancylostoma caninum]|uniref:Uncharacterized protein n=1 Tax=Ancylostoma caninum TaxID=29170 RepID=A0A368FD99_ANCCA|nr:hypothetical protein ANCCAN_24192 [Ancylostoma caninum]